LGTFVGPNLITGTLGLNSEKALTGLGFGQFVAFRGGTLQLKAPLNDAHTLSLITPGGTIDINHGFDSTFAGNVLGAGVFTKTGAGTLIFTGTNTYGGGTNINGGTLAVKSGSNLGTGPLRFHGGTLQSMAGGCGIRSSGAITLAGGGGTFVADSGTNSTLSGAISGGGAFTKTGPGTLVLTGANTYSGGTNINGGTLIINSYSNLGTGPIRFNGGVLKVLH
jgi:fibronectin-binding autotransporter adhesin